MSQVEKQDIGDKFQGDEERNMPQHVWSLSNIQKPGSLRALTSLSLEVHIEGETEEQIETATELIMPLLGCFSLDLGP